jgi:hypothetical protein
MERSSCVTHSGTRKLSRGRGSYNTALLARERETFGGVSPSTEVSASVCGGSIVMAMLVELSTCKPAELRAERGSASAADTKHDKLE